MTDSIRIDLPSITFEQLCNMAGGMHSDVFPIPRKFANRFDSVWQVWGDSPPQGLRFEVAINYDGSTRYFWVRFV